MVSGKSFSFWVFNITWAVSIKGKFLPSLKDVLIYHYKTFFDIFESALLPTKHVGEIQCYVLDQEFRKKNICEVVILWYTEVGLQE